MEVLASPEDLEFIAELAAEAMEGAENMDEALHNARARRGDCRRLFQF